MDARWATLKRMTREAIRTRFLSPLSNVNHAAITGQDPMIAFQSWFDQALSQTVLGYNGTWTMKYVRQGADAGAQRAARLVVGDAGPDDESRDERGRWISEGDVASGDKFNFVDPITHDEVMANRPLMRRMIPALHVAKTNKVIVGYRGDWHDDIVERHRKPMLPDLMGNPSTPGFVDPKTHNFYPRTAEGTSIDGAELAALQKKTIPRMEHAWDAAPRDRTPTLQTLCITELQGICEAASQQAIRTFANGLLVNQSASSVAQQVGSIIDKIGRQRSRALIAFMVVRAHAAATLDTFRAAGITHVGTVAERVRLSSSGGLTRDANEDEARDDHGRWTNGSVMYHSTSAAAPLFEKKGNIYLTPSKRYTKQYGKITTAVRVRMDKPFDVNNKDLRRQFMAERLQTPSGFESIHDYAKRKGYDATVNKKTNEAVVFSVNQLTPHIKDAVSLYDAKSKTVFPSSKILKAEKKLQELEEVDVLTAGDDDVCQDCQDIADNGPYDIDEAESLIPAHPHCRCAFVPADDARFAHDAGPDDEERDDHGRWTTGMTSVLQKHGFTKPITMAGGMIHSIHVNPTTGDRVHLYPEHDVGQHVWEHKDHWRSESGATPVDLDHYLTTGLYKGKTPSQWITERGTLDYDPDQSRDAHGMWSGLGGAAIKSYQPPAHWGDVEGQDHSIDEPPLPKLKPGQHLSSGVIMREPDGRTWLVKPTNGFGGYNYTFPKGTVDGDVHPQANAIKETWEETGLKAKITGYAGDYHGDTSVTRMYHAERVGGHPKDKGWETEQVALAHPDDLDHMLNRSRDRKIAKHHILGDAYDPNEPRNEQGEWTEGSGAYPDHVIKFKKALNANGVEYTHNDAPAMGGHDFVVGTGNKDYVLGLAEKHGIPVYSTTQTASGAVITLSEHGTTKTPSYQSASQPSAALNMQDLTKVSGKEGSNEGGTYEHQGQPGLGQYYIKKPATPDHVTNELLTAKLYQLAGVHTLNYVPVEGGAHVATEKEVLYKKNVSQLNEYERDAAKSDFAVHAWLANWDAAGTGGDNVGVRNNGEVVTLDTGGGLKYRAQGEPKGNKFGNEVGEINTLRDYSGPNPDAAKLYGDMTNEQMIASINRVTSIPDHQITNTISQNGGDQELITKLIARKYDLASQASKMATFAPAATPYPGYKTSQTIVSAPPKIILGPNTSVNPPAHVPNEDDPSAFKTKTAFIKHHLLKGTTADYLKTKLDWDAISMPQQAKATGLTLTKTKIGGGKFHYKGVPITAGDVVKPYTPPDVPYAPASLTAASAPKTILGPNTSVTPSKPATPQVPAMPGMSPLGAKHDISTPVGNFKQSLDEHGVKYTSTESGTGMGHFITLTNPSDASKAIQIAHFHPKIEKLSASEYYAPNSQHEQQATSLGAYGGKTFEQAVAEQEAKDKITKTPPTEAELTKAKKNVALQLQYVPGAPQTPEAQALVDKFNKKWHGIEPWSSSLPDQAAAGQAKLLEKVSDFKKLQASMIPLMSEQQKTQAASQIVAKAEQTQTQAKMLATQAEKKAAEKATFEAKMSDPKVKSQYDKLHSIGVSGTKDLDQSYSSSIKKLAATGHHIVGADAAYISAYTGSAYDSLNESLWKQDKMNLKQSIYASALEKALNKMPSYEGTAERGVKTPGAFARYEKNVGHVVTEAGFSSYGATHKLWGSEATIHLVAKDLKDIRAFNNHEGGGELILQRGSMLHIIKVDPKTREVWAEQIG
jgi:ADP-ribose pyrophosphatase YjhB (NUDIX family)/predicted dinucleotide-utilizing enzyme